MVKAILIRTDGTVVFRVEDPGYRPVKPAFRKPTPTEYKKIVGNRANRRKARALRRKS